MLSNCHETDNLILLKKIYVGFDTMAQSVIDFSFHSIFFRLPRGQQEKIFSVFSAKSNKFWSIDRWCWIPHIAHFQLKIPSLFLFLQNKQNGLKVALNRLERLTVIILCIIIIEDTKTNKFMFSLVSHFYIIFFTKGRNLQILYPT